MVQYREQLMPLVQMANVSVQTTGSQPILVFADDGRSMGLVVDEIIDIVEERLHIEVAGQKDGILGSAVIKGQATEVIDVGHFLPMAFADWFERKEMRTSSTAQSVLLVDDSAFFRNMVQHRQLNLLQDFSHLGVFDIIFCRNVLIYFDQNTKIDIFDRLSRMLEPDGVLALGAAESVVGITGAFKPYPDRRGLYRRNVVAAPARVGASTLMPQTLRAVASAR